MSLSAEMAEALKNEAKIRKIGSLQETLRIIASEYFMKQKYNNPLSH